MTTSPATPDLADEFGTDTRAIARIQSTLHRYPYLSPLIVLLVSMVIFTFLNERFILASNLSLMTQQAVIVGTLAIAQTLIILTAGIDLSIGAIMVFGQMMMANLAVSTSASNVQFALGLPWWLALIAGIAIAVVAGAFNGYLITQFRLPPFIVTLGTLSVFTALALIFFRARTIQGPELPAGLKAMGEATSVGSFRVMAGVVLMLALYALFAYILRSTAWGTHVYAVGDDPEAAELSGINTRRILFSVYAVAGLIIGIAGWITIGRVGSASPNVAPNINLDTITAVVIGGTSLFGGRGTMIGTLLGAMIVVVVENGLALAGLDQAYRVLAVGLLVIAAVALDQWIRKVDA
ncbi:MAG: ABC transporter permease [Actinomycetota bacterium]